VNGRGRTARVHDSLVCLCAPYELLNDLGRLFLVDLAISRLDPAEARVRDTRFADGEDAAWIRRRIADACAASGTAG
jgi:hypothetical protein